MPAVRLRALPVIVEGILYDGTNGAEVVGWVGNDAQFVEGELVVKTLDGPHIADPGETIIRGTLGEHYMIRPEVRLAKYELVGERS